MNTVQLPSDPIIAHRLLEEAALRAEGLLDVGVTAMTSGMVPDHDAFLAQRCGILRSLLVAAGAISVLEARSFKALDTRLERFVTALTRYVEDSQESASINAALAGELHASALELFDGIESLGRNLGSPLDLSPQQLEYRNRLLDHFRNLSLTTVI